MTHIETFKSRLSILIVYNCLYILCPDGKRACPIRTCFSHVVLFFFHAGHVLSRHNIKGGGGSWWCFWNLNTEVMLRPRRGGGCGGGGGCENLSCTYKLWRVNIYQCECYIWVSRFRRGYSLTNSDNDKPLAKRKPHWLQLALLWHNACATLQWQLRCLPAETANAAFWRPTDDDNPKSQPRYDKASRFVNAMIDVAKKGW